MPKPVLDFSHLSPEQRLQLIEELWESLSDGDLGPVSAELAAELDRRLANHHANPAAARPWHAVLADLRQRYK